MQICILETGAPPEALRRQFGGYPAMIERMLAPLSDRFRFSRLRIDDDGAPPSLGAADGFLITGSPAGVYEGHKWIRPLEDFIRRAAAAGRPQAGICFGHQIMAQAFGGKVEKSGKGWGVGLHAYEIAATSGWMAPPRPRLACAVSHQDQVTAPPPGARTLAGSAFCPFGALDYAQGPAISFQMHPEFDHDFAAALIRARDGRLPEGLVDESLQSLKKPSDRAIMAQWIANFFLSDGAKA